VKIQYAAKYSGSTNAYKNAIGTNWAIDMRDLSIEIGTAEFVCRNGQKRIKAAVY
jgi:hypothetical protein